MFKEFIVLKNELILKGGNDHEIYESERTIGYSVKNFEETISYL